MNKTMNQMLIAGNRVIKEILRLPMRMELMHKVFPIDVQEK